MENIFRLVSILSIFFPRSRHQRSFESFEINFMEFVFHCIFILFWLFSLLFYFEHNLFWLELTGFFRKKVSTIKNITEKCVESRRAILNFIWRSILNDFQLALSIDSIGIGFVNIKYLSSWLFQTVSKWQMEIISLKLAFIFLFDWILICTICVLKKNEFYMTQLPIKTVYWNGRTKP